MNSVSVFVHLISNYVSSFDIEILLRDSEDNGEFLIL